MIDRMGIVEADITQLDVDAIVNAANATDYMKESDIDGALVGGASLDADSFVEIVRAAAEARP